MTKGRAQFALRTGLCFPRLHLKCTHNAKTLLSYYNFQCYYARVMFTGVPCAHRAKSILGHLHTSISGVDQPTVNHTIYQSSHAVHLRGSIYQPFLGGYMWVPNQVQLLALLGRLP